jgi:cytochrome c peroxidase
MNNRSWSGHRIPSVIYIILSLSIALSSCSDKKETVSEYQWPIIKGFPKPQVPHDNLMTQAKVNLGKALFFDKNLSANKQQACASCHHQKFAFGENIPHSVGSTKQVHRRNSPV